jgi:hypothetical protein
MRKTTLILGTLLLGTAAAVAAQQPDPATMAGKDTHDGVTVACVPITDAAQAKERFGKKHPQEVGILALEVFIRNDNSDAVRIEMDTVRLVIEPRGGSRQRLRPIHYEDVAFAIVNKEPPNPSSPRKRLPTPIPMPGEKKSKDVDKVAEVLRPLVLEMDVIPPRATVKGFLFFDLAKQFDLVRSSSLYLPDLFFVQSGKALLFFEVYLAPAVK